MFKKRGRPQAARARDEAGADDGDIGSVPVANKRARNATAAASSSAAAAAGGEGGIIAASTKRGDADAAAKRADKFGDVGLTGFKANDAVSLNQKGDATRRLEVDTEKSHDTRAVLERNQEIHKGLKSGTLEAGVYRGSGAYKQYAERGEGAIANSKYSGQLGPCRGITNVRSTLRIEFIGTTGEGGICKDYKETGYCGFGDSCKFLHDRSDYKPSYILEKEWEDKQKAIQDKKRKRWEKRMQRKALAKGQKPEGSDEESSDADSDKSTSSESEDDLPGACQECKTPWEQCTSMAVVTLCGHYFCEDCAMTNFVKSPNCLVCNMPTNGIFNSADAIEEKLKAKKAMAAEKKKAKGRQVERVYGVGLEE